MLLCILAFSALLDRFIIGEFGADKLPLYIVFVWPSVMCFIVFQFLRTSVNWHNPTSYGVPVWLNRLVAVAWVVSELAVVLILNNTEMPLTRPIWFWISLALLSVCIPRFVYAHRFTNKHALAGCRIAEDEDVK